MLSSPLIYRQFRAAFFEYETPSHDSLCVEVFTREVFVIRMDDNLSVLGGYCGIP